jgi:ribonuclease-3
VVTDTLFRTHPDLPEGQLAKLRAAVVSAKALANVARTLGVGEYLLLGRGEHATGGRDKASILSDTVEAIIGAIYVQFGIEGASAVIHRVFDPVMADAATLGAGLDWKTSLQEFAADHGLGVPHYVLDSSGPDHDKRFSASVCLSERTFDGGVGRSKKEAEQEVAEIAWRVLSVEVGARSSPA